MYEIPEKPQIKREVKQPDQRKFCVLPLSILKTKKCTLGMLRVLICLASYCNKSGSSFVSLDRIGSDLGITRQAVGQHMKKLINQGIVKEYKNYYKNIKGATRRIVYDETLTDEEVQQISNDPIEPYDNKEINLKYAELQGKKINELDKTPKVSGVALSRQKTNELVASLFECVSTERETKILETVLHVLTPEEVSTRLKSGQSVEDIKLTLDKAPLAPPPPGL
jgi:DNA-binding MarR family transcriptional regulator